MSYLCYCIERGAVPYFSPTNTKLTPAACFPSVLRAVTQTTPIRSITHLTTAPVLHNLDTQTLTLMSLMMNLMMMTRCLSLDTAKHCIPLMVRSTSEISHLSLSCSCKSCCVYKSSFYSYLLFSCDSLVMIELDQQTNCILVF